MKTEKSYNGKTLILCIEGTRIEIEAGFSFTAEADQLPTKQSEGWQPVEAEPFTDYHWLILYFATVYQYYN